MSQVHFRDVTLAALLERLHVVVVARPATPAQRIEHEDLAGHVFEHALARLEVVECMFADEPLAPGTLMEVESANTSARQRMHADYYGRGLSRSPLFESFAGAPLDGPVIALVHRVRDRYAWTVDVSAIALAERPRIDAAIARLRSRS